MRSSSEPCCVSRASNCSSAPLAHQPLQTGSSCETSMNEAPTGVERPPHRDITLDWRQAHFALTSYNLVDSE